MVSAEKIIDSVVEITRHGEEYVLSESLAAALYRLLEVEVVLLVEIVPVETNDGQANRTSIVAATGSETFTSTENVTHIPASTQDLFTPLFEKCLEEGQQQAVACSTHSAYVLPIASDKNISYLLGVKHTTLSATDCRVVDGMARVFGNYLHVLSDGKRDTLTGLLNRRAFLEKVNRTVLFGRSKILIGETDRRQEPADQRYWLAIFDIDHFKRVNDTYGHVYGDEVLILLATQMRECFRAGDLLFRYGGEEFIVVIGSTVKENAENAFERFRLQISKKHFGKIEQITVSIGLVEVCPESDLTTVVGQADQALYYAKEHGRNQLAVYADLVAGEDIVPPEVQEDIEIF